MRSTTSSPAGCRLERKRARNNGAARTVCDFDRSALDDETSPSPAGTDRPEGHGRRTRRSLRLGRGDGRALDALTKRPRRLAVLAAGLLTGALVFGGWSLWSRPGSEPHPTPRFALSAKLPGPAIAGPAAPSLHIESFQVALHRRVEGDPSGLVGIDVFTARLSQDARVHVQFNRPAYGFLIALNPDVRDPALLPRSAGDRTRRDDHD